MRIAMLLILALPTTTIAAQQITPEAKAKITEKLDSATQNSLVVFNHSGEQTSEVPLGKASTKFDSLSDYVYTVHNKAVQTSNSEVTEAHSQPIATCVDPKALPDPPPTCVICKDGTVLCTKAQFGARMTKMQFTGDRKPPQP